MSAMPEPEDADAMFRSLGSWIPRSPWLRRWHSRDRDVSERRLARTPAHPLYWARRSIFRSVSAAAEGRSGVVVDVGCGETPYRRLFRDFRYVGLDLSRDGGADVIADAAALPLAADSADAVLCTEVLEHVADPDRCMREIARVLKPGGVAICTVPFAFPIHDAHDYRRLAPEGLRRLTVAAGLEIASVKPLCGTGRTLAMLLNLYLFDLAAYWKRRFYVLSIPLRPLVWAATALVNLGGAIADALIPSTHLPFGHELVAFKPPSATPQPTRRESTAGPGVEMPALACPGCGGLLEPVAAGLECRTCRLLYPVERGVPVLLAARARPYPAADRRARP